ncbi:Alpha/Beta hydrolase protein [Aspergillus keveii]|uniref:Alpha/Beta hydrolase protein n=1 Tax=Aspergillus keveii TaxID=714993 RepID=A0ABR4FS63_9EURO
MYKTVANEGANLHVWSQGQGPLLILIPPGGGDSARFTKVISNLSNHYTVATYDRRGNGKSTVSREEILNPSESARDVVAIIKDLGFSKASLFGPSSGGLIALTLAAGYPQLVDHVILHEVPTFCLLTDEPIDRLEATFAVYRIYLQSGPEAALEAFRETVAGRPIAGPPPSSEVNVRNSEVEPHRLDYFLKNEFLVLSIFTPNLEQVKAGRVSVATVEGSASGDMFYAKAARAQAEVLGCPHFVWDGGHEPFQTNPEEFVADIERTLSKLDATKAIPGSW